MVLYVYLRHVNYFSSGAERLAFGVLGRNDKRKARRSAGGFSDPFEWGDGIH